MRFVPGCALDPDGVSAYIKLGQLKKQGQTWPAGFTLQLLAVRARSRGSVGACDDGVCGEVTCAVSRRRGRCGRVVVGQWVGEWVWVEVLHRRRIHICVHHYMRLRDCCAASRTTHRAVRTGSSCSLVLTADSNRDG